jgi:hypothetical protein
LVTKPTEEDKEEPITKEMEKFAELSQLDELDPDEAVDILGAEITRDYQGVLPLNGQPYKQQKYPIKQGTLVETRGGYTPLLWR